MLQRSCDVDVVDAHARAADDAQPTSGAVPDRGSAEHRRRAHDDGVEILQAAAGELGIGEMPIYDFRAGLLEQLHRRGREPVSDEDGGYGRRGEDQGRGCNEGEHPLTTRRVASRASRRRASRPQGGVSFRRKTCGTGKKTPGGAGTHTGHTGHTVPVKRHRAGTHTGHTSAHADSRFCTFLTDTTALATSSVQRLDNVWRTPIGMLWAPLGSSALS